MQRCAAHLASGTDIAEAFAAGEAAVRAALAGVSGHMVVLRCTREGGYTCRCETADIHGIANAEKTVPPEWIDTANATVTPEFLAYVRPLITGEAAAVWQDGLPVHFRL